MFPFDDVFMSASQAAVNLVYAVTETFSEADDDTTHSVKYSLEVLKWFWGGLEI